MTDTAWRADPLEWGTGPRTFEVFLEPTCPFSVRAFGKLDALLAEAGRDRITIKLRLQSQPWHMYSGVVTRCVIAASTLPAGKEAAKKVLAAVAAHREEFEFAKHAGGPNMTATRSLSSETATPPNSGVVAELLIVRSLLVVNPRPVGRGRARRIRL